VQKEQILARFLTNMPARFEAATNDVRLCATLIDCDPTTGRATAVQRIMLRQE
jgi:calcineurin-like phosphoesterase